MPTLIEIARAYILRGKAYSALQEHFTEGGFKDYDDGQKCMDRIKAIPAADVVEVVKCGECQYYNAGFEWLIEGYGIERPNNYFCADGKRKNGEQDGTA